MNEQEFNEKIDAALKLRDVGKTKEANDILSNFVKRIPKNYLSTLSIVGALFLEAKDFTQAFNCYQKAVETDPQSSSASIGLFHALWGMERHSDAFSEYKRFLSVAKSDTELQDHFLLLEEIRDAALAKEDGDDESTS